MDWQQPNFRKSLSYSWRFTTGWRKKNRLLWHQVNFFSQSTYFLLICNIDIFTLDPSANTDEKRLPSVDVSVVNETLDDSRKERSPVRLRHSWNFLKLSRALKKRGRPKGTDKGLFKSYHQRSKKRRSTGKCGGPRTKRPRQLDESVGFVVDDILEEEEEMRRIEMSSPIPQEVIPDDSAVTPYKSDVVGTPIMVMKLINFLIKW